jgi:hypothetical protein
MYRSHRGFPPITATHYRQNKCGVHRHAVCQNCVCSSHVDQFNPDCSGIAQTAEAVRNAGKSPRTLRREARAAQKGTR